MTTTDWDSLSDEQLDVMERKIATTYMRIIPWGAVVWGIGNLIIWLSLWPLVLLEIIPLWLGFAIALINGMCAYLPSHEAQHNIIANRGQPLRWLNELVGHLSTIPLVMPYRVLRHTHYEHHRHCNNPELDPDYGVHAANNWQFLWRSILNQQPGSGYAKSYSETLERTGNGHMMIDALVYEFVHLAVLFGFAWSGYAIEVALLWWLPKHMATTYLRFYLSYAPHHPGKSQSRYGDTRAFKSYLGNIISMGMQYHIVHHLYPRIPLSKTPAAYRELKPILKRKGCDLGAL